MSKAPKTETVKVITKSYRKTPQDLVSVSGELVLANGVVNQVEIQPGERLHISSITKSAQLKKRERAGAAGERKTDAADHQAGDDAFVAIRNGANLRVVYDDGTEVSINNFFNICETEKSCGVLLPLDDKGGSYVISGDSPRGIVLSHQTGEVVLYAHGSKEAFGALLSQTPQLASLDGLAWTSASEGARTYMPDRSPAAVASSGSQDGLSTSAATLGVLAFGAALSKLLKEGESQITMSGNVGFGPVLSGNDLVVTAYDANGKFLGQDTSVDPVTGAYSLKIRKDAGPVVIKVTSAGAALDFRDEASAANLNLSTVIIMAVANVTNSDITVNVNPLTDLAARRVTTVGMIGAVTGSKIDAANLAITKAYIDPKSSSAIIALTPNFTVDTAGSSTVSTANKLGQLLAQLSVQAKTAGSIDAAQAATAATITWSADNSTATLGGLSRQVDVLTKVAQAAALATGADASAVLTVADLKNLNLSGFNALNATRQAGVIADIVASANNGSAVQTQTQVQTLVTKQTARAKIENFAEQGTTAPTLQDYIDAGYSNVTSANLTAVTAVLDASNAQTGTFSDANVQTLISQGVAAQIAALAKITAYATSSANAVPALADYVTAGITGVTDKNLSALNKLVDAAAGNVDAGTVAQVQALVSTAQSNYDAAYIVLRNYATDPLLYPAPTVDQFQNAGNPNIIDANLATSTAILASFGASITPTDVARKLPAILKISAWADNSSTPSAAPTVQDYLDAGVPTVTNAKLALYNSRVDALLGSNVQSTAQVVTAINTIAIKAVTVAFSADTGEPNDLITNTPAQTISGTINAALGTGEKVQVSLDGGNQYIDAVTTGTNWSVTGQTLQASNTLKVRVVDDAANIGTALSQAYVLDQTIGAVDLVSAKSGVQDSESQYYAIANANAGAGVGKAIVPNAALPADNDIAKITITVAGAVADTDNDKLLVGTSTVNLDSTAKTGSNITVGGVVGVDWSYSTDKVLTLSKTAGGVFTASQVQAIETALQFKTTTNATQGDRTFAVAHIDLAGNTSAAGTETVTVDTVAPGPIDLVSTTANVQAAESQYYAFALANAGTGKAIVPLATDTDIAKISITVAGAVADTTNDKLLMGGATVNLNTTAQTGSNIDVNGLAVDWSYSTDKVLTISKTGAGVFTVQQVQAIETALQFKTTGAIQGDRTFAVAHIDRAGNTSLAGTETVTVDTLIEAVDLITNTADVQNSESQYYALANANLGKAIVPNVVKVTDTDIAKIRIAAGGTGADTNNDILLVGSSNVGLSNSTQNGSTTISGIAVDWSYNTSKELTISKTGGGALTPDQVQAIETSLQFKTTANATQGERTFAVTRVDLAGNTSAVGTETVMVDTIAPSDLDLDVNSQTVQASESQYYAIVNANAGESVGKAIVPNVTLPTDTDIAKITITVAGSGADETKDTLLLGSSIINLSSNATAINGSTTVSDVTVDWTYSTDKVLTISKPDGSAFTAENVQAIEAALQFQTTTTANQGDRTFALTHTDLAGNTSVAGTETVTVDTIAPSDLDLDVNSQTVQANESQYYAIANANAGKAIVPNVVTSTDTDIAKIRITTTGVDINNDTLLIGSSTANLSASAQTGSTTVAGTGVDWRYSTDKVLTLSKTGGGAFTAEQVQAIEASLQFKTTSNASQGDRTFAVVHIDLAGNTSTAGTETVKVDTLAPSALDLVSSKANVQAIESQYYAFANAGAGKAIVPNVAASTDTDIAKITIVVAGAGADTNNDKLLIGADTLNLNTTPDSRTNVTVGTVSGVDWGYSAGKVLTISKNGGGAFAADDVQKIETALKFQTSAGATQGDRTFAVTHTDLAGNTSAVGTETVTVDTVVPSDIDLTSAIPNVQATESQYYAFANAGAGKAIVPNVKLTTDTDIAKISIKIAGAGADTTYDTLLIGTSTVNLSTVAQTGSNVIVGGVAGVDWSYSTDKVLTLSKNGGGVFTRTQVQAIETALQFKTTANATQGDRTFALSHIDLAGNPSTVGTETVTVDTVVPGDLDLISAMPNVQANESQYYASANANAGKFIVPNVALVADADIAKITVTIGGAGADAANDQLQVGTSTVILNTTPDSRSNITVGGIMGVNWSYSADKVLTISKNGDGAFAASDVQAIEAALKFKTTANATQGERTFAVAHVDLAGNTSASGKETVTVDTKIEAVDLVAGTANGQLGVQAAESQYYAVANSGTAKAIVPNVAQVTDTDIAKITVTVAGTDIGQDQLLMGGATVNLSATAQPGGNTTVNGVSVDWSYSASKVLTISKPNGGAFTAADVQKIEAALQFKTASAVQGDRSFTVAHIDLAGNTSAVGVETVKLDTVAPAALDLISSSGTVDASESQYYAFANAGTAKAIVPNVKLSADTDIAKISIKVGGADTAHDTLQVGASTINLNITAQEGSSTVGGVTGVDWRYGSDQVLTLSKTGNGAFTAADVKAIEAALTFKTTTDATQGNRTFEIAHIDLAGNSGTAGTETVTVDTVAPKPLDLDVNSLTVQAAESQYYAFTNAGTAKAIVPNVVQATDTDITKITITAAGTDVGHDLLVLNATNSVALDTTAKDGNNVIVGGVAVNWGYTADKVLTLSNPTGVAFTPLDIKAIETALKFQTTAGANQGDRTFAVAHVDLAGNTSDVGTETVKVDTQIQAVDLITATANVQAAERQYYAFANVGAGKPIVPNVALPTEADIAKIRITVAGAVADTTNDTVLLGASTINLSTTAQNGSTTVGVTGVDWSYSAGKVLTVSKTGGGEFSAADVQAIETALKFQTAEDAVQGERTFTVAHIDLAGNISTAGTETVTVDTTAEAVDLITATAGVQATESQYYASANANAGAGVGKAIVPNVALGTDADIEKITVAAAGTDAANDTLLLGASTVNLNTGVQNGNNVTVTLNGVTALVDWNYSVDKVLTIIKTGGGSFSAAQVQAIEAALQFKTTANATQGDRTFTVAHVDAAGNTSASGKETVTVDTKIDAIDLIASTANANVDATQSQYYAIADVGTAKAIVPNVALVTDADIVKINIQATGTDVNKDTLVLGASNIGLSASAQNGSITVNGTGVDWAYSAGKLLTLSKTGGGVFTAAQVQAIEAALKFKTTVDATQGDRSFAITHIDLAGNTSAAATETVMVNTQIQALDLVTGTGVGKDGVQALESQYYAFANAGTGKAIVPNVAVSTDTDLAKITVTVAGAVADTTNDKLLVGADIVSLDTTAKTGSNITVGTVTGVDWNYSADKVLTLSKNGGGVFAAADVQKIEQALQFKTTGAIQGDRTFTVAHVDVAGNTSASGKETVTVDTTVGDVDLISTTAGVQATESQYYAITNAGNAKLIIPNVALATDTDIAKIRITAAGLGADETNDKLLIGANTILLSTNANTTSNSTTVDGVSVDWSYNTSKELTISKPNGGAFTAAEVQTIEAALQFKTIVGATQGNRTFEVAHIDLAGNTSVVGTETVKVDTVAPTALDLDAATAPAVDATESQYYASANAGAGKDIVPNVAQAPAGDTDIVKISITVAGANADEANDQLLVGTSVVTLNTAAQTGSNVTVGAVNGVDWSYSTDKVLTISKNGGGVLTPTQVQAIEKALQFKTTADALQGARTFEIAHIDSVGNTGTAGTETVTVDTKIEAVDLISGTGAGQVGVQAAESQYYANVDAGAGKAILPNMALVADQDIVTITVTVAGAAADTANDQLLMGASTVNLDTNTQPNAGTSTATVGGVDVNWSYNYSASAGKVLTISKNGGGAFAAADVQAIEQALQFQTDANATQGERTFKVTHTDLAGNTSAAATETVKVATKVGAVDLVSASVGVQDSESQYYAVANSGTGKAIVPNVALAADTNIAKISITVAGTDVDFDQLLVGGSTVNLDATAQPVSGTTSTTVDGVDVDWSYSAGQVLTISKTGGGAFTAAEVQTIEKALKFQTATAATSGDRSFEVAHIDLADNTSPVGTETVTVDMTAPEAIDLLTNTVDYASANVSAGKAIVLDVAQADDTDIAKISITVAGDNADEANDQLLVGTSTVSLNTNAQTGSNVTVGGVTGVDWSYGTDKVLTISKNDGGAFAAADVQAIEKALKFKTTADALQGERTFEIAHIDLAGNPGTSGTETVTVDTKIEAVDLVAGTANVQATESQYFTSANVAAGKAIVPNVAVSTDTDLAKITVTVAGAGADTANDQLLVGGDTVNLNTSDQNDSNITVGTVSGVDWSYSASAGKVLTLSKTGGGAFSAADVQAIEQALTFKTTANATQGDRTFAVAHVDAVGNTSAAGTETVTVDTKIDAVDLVLGTGSGKDGVQNTESQYYVLANANAGKFIVPNVAQVTDADIAKIRITAADVDALNDNEKLLVGSTWISLNATLGLNGISTVGGVPNVSWTYSNKVLTISKNGGGAFTAAEVQTIEQALQFKTTANAAQGDRTFTVAHIDLRDNTSDVGIEIVKVDTVAPGAIDLISSSDAVNTSESQYYASANAGAGKAIVPNVGEAPLTDIDIAEIRIKVAGAGADATNDTLLVGTSTVSLNTSAQTGSNVTVGGVAGVDWSYSYSASEGKVLTISKNDGSAFATVDVKAIEAALKFKTTANATQGNRTFEIAHIDLAGNPGTAGTETVKVDTQIQAVDLNSLSSGVDATASQGFASANVAAGIAIVPNVVLSTDADIVQITVTVGGAGADTANDKLVLDATNTVALDTNTQPNAGTSTATVNGVSVDWSYSASKVLTITKPGGGAFTATQVQAIEQALTFKTTTNATQGDRTFAVAHVDAAGNTSAAGTETVTVDTKIDAVDLVSATVDVQAAESQNYALANAGAGKAILPNVALPTDADIAKITIKVAGIADTTNDKLLVGANTVNLNTASTSASSPITVGGVANVNWDYNYNVSTGKVLTLSKPGAATFTAAEVQAIEQALQFKTTADALQGDRTFTVTHIDSLDNTSVVGVETVKVDTVAPTAGTLSTTIVTDAGGVLAPSVTSASTALTQDTSWGLSGTGAEAGATVSLWDGLTQVGTATVATNGSWSATTRALSTGAHTITAKITDAAGNTATIGSNQATIYTASQSVIDLGVGNGKLILPVQVEGNWYYFWDRNGDVAVSTADRLASHDVLDAIFTKDVNGVTGGGGNTNDTYRYGSINGAALALPTAGSAVTSPPNRPGTSNIGTGTTINATYDDLLAIWDAFNGVTTSSAQGFPPSWFTGDYYWSSTPSTSGHFQISPAGAFFNASDSDNQSIAALQVLAADTTAPTATLSTSGSAFNTATASVQSSETGTAYLVKSTDTVYSTSDLTALADSHFNSVAITTANTATTLSLAGLEPGTYQLYAADAAGNLSAASSTSLNVNVYTVGQSVIDLGSYGKLIAPVQVEGKWYYHWDRSGDGTSANTGSLNGGTDLVNHNVLDALFTKDVNGNANPGSDTTDVYRYANLSGVAVALPTLGGGTIGSSAPGTGASGTGTANNPTYDDLLAIWDSQNGTGTGINGAGVPAGWINSASNPYWASTAAGSGHAALIINNGLPTSLTDTSLTYVALQVL